MKKLARFAVCTNSIIFAGLCLYLFLTPFFSTVYYLQDPALGNAQIPRTAAHWHQNLSKPFGKWARKRVDTAAANSNINDISGTEWPIFSAVFYLWATESLQQQNQGIASGYAADAIDASAQLIADPNHAAWVKQHWGDDYLSRENLFYRMLLISGLTSYQSLTGNQQYQDLLLKQVTSLSQELDASPFGLLDDYPGQCYPIDILPAIAVIQRAGEILKLDFSQFVARSLRGFSGPRLDPESQLPTYYANSKTGQGYGPARGIGASFMLIWAPEVWPDTARRWYANYEKHFWQEGFFLAGIREFSAFKPYPDWWIDVDSGPVIAGFGTAASAYGIGAARANGRFDHAYPLSAEALVSAWPLLDGTLLIPRLLSNLSDAPYVGETALLFNFTRQPINTDNGKEFEKQLPLFVYIVLSVYLLLGCYGLHSAYSRFRLCWTSKTLTHSRFLQMQLALWLFLIGISALLLLTGHTLTAVLLLIFTQIFPRIRKTKDTL